MSVRPYQFEPLKMCWGNTEEHCGDKGEISNAGEYNENYMETRGDSIILKLVEKFLRTCPLLILQ